MNFNQTFYIKPTENEIVHTTIRLSSDTKPALIGTVTDNTDKPIDNALVTLYLANKPTEPISAIYTDENGHFAFAPLENEMLYKIGIFKNNDKFRTIE